MGLPGSFHLPVDVALAKASATVPRPESMRGGAQYEAKLDGFRTVLVRDGGSTQLWSRQRKTLSTYFPEVVKAARLHIPDGYVLDGETVIWSDGRLDFDAMQRRMGRGAAGSARLAKETPASYVAFDLLVVAGHDIRQHPLTERRALLEELAKTWEPPLNLNAATTDYDEAVEWMGALPSVGVEGLVVKALSGRYEAGQRQWVKVKHRDTVDVVAGAVIGSVSRPSELIVGLWRDGALRIAGRSSPLAPHVSRTFAELIRPADPDHPWPTVVKPGAVSHFNTSRDPVHLTLIEPIVVEVSADTAWSGESFRHSVRFIRARPEIDPRSVRT